VTAKPLGVGLLGVGTIGSAVARAFAERQKRIDAAAGRTVRLLGAAVRDPKKTRNAGGVAVTGDPFAISGSSRIARSVSSSRSSAATSRHSISCSRRSTEGSTS